MTDKYPTRAGVLNSLPRSSPDPFRAYDFGSILRREAKNLELDVSDRIAKQNPTLGAAGTWVPFEVLTRDLTLTSGGGADLVSQELPPTIAEALRPYSVVAGNGATILTNLKGNFLYPRFAIPNASNFYTETAVVASDTDTTVGVMPLTAHRISSTITLSKQLIYQAHADIEALVKRELLANIGSSIDNFALNGTGVAPQPLGLLNIGTNSPSGAQSLSLLSAPVTFGGAATFDSLNTFVTEVQEANVQDDGTFAWALSPATEGKWRVAQKVSGYPSYLLEDGKVLNYPARGTNNLSTNQAIFARWSDVFLGIFGSGVDVLVDPVSHALLGQVRIFLTTFVDVNVLRGVSVVTSTDSAAQ